MSNPRNQAYYEESYITICQSLLNQEIKWLGYQKWKLIIRVEYSKSHPRRVNAKARSYWQPSWSQKEQKWQQSIWCKLKSKKLFIMFPEYTNTVLLRGVCGWSENNQIKSFHPSKTETSSQTLSGPAGQCLASLEDQPSSKNTHRNLWPDNVRAHRTFQNLLEKASFLQRAPTGQCPRFESKPNG
jgi:hypothetical protein